MFLQVIWNPNLKQTSLLVSPIDSNEDFPVIVSFLLKEDISTAFIQNFIGNDDLQFLYIDDTYLWLENFHLTKNILAFFNVIDFIDLTQEDINYFNQFILKNKLSLDDYDNLGYQSPVKTIPRDLSTKPAFMSAFLDVGDFSKRLLRTTFDFEHHKILITINKRVVSAQHFFNHLNSDRDRLRIKESLAFPFDKKSELIEFISSLDIYSEDEFVSIEKEPSEEIQEETLEIEVVENEQISSNNPLILDSLEKTLTKTDTLPLVLNSFLIAASIIKEEVNTPEEVIKEDKRQEVLEDFSQNNFDDFFATERNIEDFHPPTETYSEGYDNSVYVEQPEENIPVIDNEVIDELTEDFLVEIETNLEKHEQSIKNNVLINTSEELEEHEDISDSPSISVDELVDSINDIFEEPALVLELIDIIELPLILFLAEEKEIKENKNSDDFLDNYFVNNNVNEEINQFSAEDVLTVVNTEVSIFENTVSDKKKKSGKSKKDKRSQNAISDIVEETNVEHSPIDLKNDISKELIHIDNNEQITQEIVEYESLPIEPIVSVLEKIEIIRLPVYSIISSIEIKKPLLIHSIENLLIIEFLLSVDLIDDSFVLEESSDPNFNFFEESKKKLVDLAMTGDLDGIEELYRNYPEFEKPLLNFNYEGDNPLCIASFYENIDLIKQLIDYGWNPNYFDSNLNNALIIAAAEGHKHIVRYLLTQEVQINFQNKIGYTALHFAVNDCNHRIVKLLLEAGADVEISDNDRNTPLSIAAFKGDINSTKLLLQTRINVHTKNKKGYDARSIALIAKNHAVAKLIEDKIVSEKHNHSLPPIIEKNV